MALCEVWLGHTTKIFLPVSITHAKSFRHTKLDIFQRHKALIISLDFLQVKHQMPSTGNTSTHTCANPGFQSINISINVICLMTQPRDPVISSTHEIDHTGNCT